MFNAFERRVAFRYLRARRKEGFISVIAGFSFTGIALGVATLIVVMAVMNGFRTELMERILGINAHITVSGYSQPISDHKTLSTRLKNISNIDTAFPIVKGQALATANGKHSGVVVRGMKLDDLKSKKMISENIIIGKLWERMEEYERKNSVIIGSRMSRSMRLLPGDTIRLISPQTTQTFFGNMPRLKDYTVSGVFEVGMIEYDSSTIFMPLDSAQLYFKTEKNVTEIEIEVSDIKNIASVKDEISKLIPKNYHIIDWEMANKSFIDSLKVERNVMFLILTLIIVIAAFNIVSGMVMLVTDKGKEIAILRTIGATRGSIMRIFFMCGAAIGVVGTFLGLLLGLSFAANIEEIRHWLEGLTDTDLFSAEIYFLSKLPADVQIGDVVNITGMALILSLAATLYPAWRAAKISPAEGLRYE